MNENYFHLWNGDEKSFSYVDDAKDMIIFRIEYLWTRTNDSHWVVFRHYDDVSSCIDWIVKRYINGYTPHDNISLTYGKHKQNINALLDWIEKMHRFFEHRPASSVKDDLRFRAIELVELELKSMAQRMVTSS